MSKSTRYLVKNRYLAAREQAGISRETAAERLHMSTRTLARYELGEGKPGPGDVLNMAAVYEQPLMSAWYCAEECPIGQRYAYRPEEKDLATTVLGLLKSLSYAKLAQERLLEMAEDGNIDSQEMQEFVKVLLLLMEMERKIEALKHWASGVLSIEKLVHSVQKEKAAAFATAR